MAIVPNIKHVFVLMLENHSFDNMLAMSGIPGITGATTSNRNIYNGTNYYVQKGAPSSMSTDPGHEFLDVLQQLTLQTAYTPGKYPTINNDGFAANYAISTTEPPNIPPAPDKIDDIMKCFDTPSQLPVLYSLAKEFAVCDHWFSSLPGPTWPNRFFMHGASSSGLDDSPTDLEYAEWMSVGFQYKKGSIFQRLGAGNYRIYHDCSGPIEGWIPQTESLYGISTLRDLYQFGHFEADLHNGYTVKYTFIEPSYGQISSTYAGGSSQHPMDSVHQGERLIKSTYEAIRNSPLWESSLLVITYDEHGGFYDSVVPPQAIPPLDDSSVYGYNRHGFDFTQYGPRVPAVVISPLIQKGFVSNTVFDHSSVIATLNQLFGYGPLTSRDRLANNLLGVLTLSEPRTDCLKTLPDPVPKEMDPKLQINEIEEAILLQQPIPKSGNLIGFLQIALKSNLEVVGENYTERMAAIELFKAIRTRQDAKIYIEHVVKKVQAVKNG